MAKQKVPEFESEQVLWQGRKCILGLPISFTKYIVEQERLIIRVGFFRTVVDEILLYRILDLKLVRTLGQKMAGVGSIRLYTADASDAEPTLKNIKRSEKVWRFLSNIIEQRRVEHGIAGREMYGARVADSPADFVDVDGDGIPDVPRPDAPPPPPPHFDGPGGPR